MVLTASWPATLMMRPKVGFGDDINRGLLKSKLASGSVGLMFVGDSITNNYVTGRVSQSCVKRWPINTCGAMSGMLGNGDSGWPISNPPPDNNPVSNPTDAGNHEPVLGPSGGGLRPGDQFLDGTSGHNLLRTIPTEFTGDYSSFSPTYRGWFYPNNAFNSDWDSGQNVRARLVYRANTLAPTDHRIVGRTRGSPGQSDAGNTQFNAQTNSGQILTQTVDFARGTGTNPLEYVHGRTWNTVEQVGWRCDYLAMSFELQTRPTGSVFWAYAGEGGYTSRSHHTAGEALNVGGFGTYTTFYSDAALDAHLLAFNLNTFFIYLGQNISGNEGSGSNIGSYKSNIETIISRYKAACTRVGISNPTFILVSLYPTSDDNTRTINIATALREIALADTACEFIDLRKFVVQTYGNYSTWQASFAPDSIHPNATFSNIIADYLWSKL